MAAETVAPADAETSPGPGTVFTVEIEHLPCMTSPAVGWDGDASSNTLILANGLKIDLGSSSTFGRFRCWFVRTEGILRGYISARVAHPSDAALIDAISGVSDGVGSDPVEPGSSGLRLAGWGERHPPHTCEVLSVLPMLADLFVGADDEHDATNSAMNLTTYMQRRFGPPNVSYDPNRMPYGAWAFATPVHDLMIWVAPYELLSLQIRVFVGDGANRALRKAWVEVMLSVHHGVNVEAVPAFVELVSPYRQVLRRCVLDLLHPVTYGEESIDPYGFVQGWRFSTEVVDCDDEVRPLDAHPLSTMALPPQITAHPGLFQEFCMLVSEAEGGAEAALRRMVDDLRTASNS